MLEYSHPVNQSVIRERIQEIVDFATKESPYRDANKGWVNDDVYVQLGGSDNETKATRGDQVADVAIYWDPLNSIALILLIVIFGFKLEKGS